VGDEALVTVRKRMTPPSLAVVGGGWSGLAAAVRATEAGYRVSLFEMATHWGGRARSVDTAGFLLDNGQHILIGAYERTLALMRTVGTDLDQALHHQPLELRYPDGRGLRVASGPAWLGFGVGVLGSVGWRWREKLALLLTAASWGLKGFVCPPHLTVDALCRDLPQSVRQLLIDPLCVAALNTPAVDASATVFLRVMRDSLFGGPGSSDLLLPRQALSELLPLTATRWLESRATSLRLGRRVTELSRRDGGWAVDGQAFDGVILACSATEAARLTRSHAPSWANAAQAIKYEPIITAYLHCPGARLPRAMMALVQGPDAPAQFALDHGALGSSPGVFAFVVSGARAWVEQGLEKTGQAIRHQAMAAFAPETWPEPPNVLRVMAERRATFRCTPNLRRPGSTIAAGLTAAGDFIEGPYPSTLEGAVRSGETAVQLLRV
jgi:squalene-associated FAD-dependent desaturase